MRNQVSMAVTMALLIVSILGVSISDKVGSVPSVTTTLTGMCCTVAAQSFLTVHVADQKGNPIPNALVIINGTFSCFVDGQFCPLLDAQSARTDSNGDAHFGVYPLAKYNVTVTLPETCESPIVIVTQIKAPEPTFGTTLDMACTQTTTTAGWRPSAIPFIGVPEILIAILLGVFVVARRRRGKLGLG